MTPRHFLSLRDVNSTELHGILETASRLKAGTAGRDRPLAGLTLAMLFRKHSTRTRISFETGMFQLGGLGVSLSDRDSHIGRGESIADTARVLSRFVDGMLMRTYAHAEIEDLAAHSSVPVINGLTDLLHPCQLLADLQVIREEFGPAFEKLTVAWIGDGNNVANSWLNAAALLGFELRLAIPKGYDPDPGILDRARKEGNVTLVRDPVEAVEGAHVVTTDTWASMGQESENEVRSKVFRSFQVDAKLLERAHANAIFLHCLPAYRGKEVTEEVLDGPRSRIWDEAENRLHAQKALLLFLLGRPRG